MDARSLIGWSDSPYPESFFSAGVILNPKNQSRGLIRVLGRVGELFVGLVDRTVVMDENRDQGRGIHARESARDILVGTGLDQVDVMALIRNTQFGQTDPRFLRAKREGVVMEFPLLLVGRGGMLVNAAWHHACLPLKVPTLQSVSPSCQPFKVCRVLRCGAKSTIRALSPDRFESIKLEHSMSQIPEQIANIDRVRAFFTWDSIQSVAMRVAGSIDSNFIGDADKKSAAYEDSSLHEGA